MFDIFKNRLEVTGTLKTITAIRISAGRSNEPIGSDLPVIKDALGNPLIPGSSFKGALRSRLESFLRGILGSDRRLVADPSDEKEWSIRSEELSEFKKSLEKLSQYERESSLNEYIIGHTDLISRLFGSPWLASKFQVRDLTVIKDTWFGQYQERDGVSIDRDTETAADGKLYNYQVVPAGTEFEFKCVVENAEGWELGLLMIGLHQFEAEQIPLGGGRSRGLGVVKLTIDKMNWIDVTKEVEKDPEDGLFNPNKLKNSEPDPQKMLKYLKKLAGLEEAQEREPVPSDEERKTQWTQELITYLSCI
ncbi:CRISPR-associated protein, Csx7 family [Thalassoporum mexicanum PCC 7367]|uniref:type III CRISPR-associated RAMP protein Csx7 n=1 Tax=Thalassoporum mexicanum TaxID=3457544 RepID=UPI00029FA171|nr:CRISPR-associated RAMP protein Csx7 [Pseudanabaena sp. PCC 7367]AFY68745.1 CRISPR-associated protein, Csx7 family [Pseudanabaena sp. PCC 7367]